MEFFGLTLYGVVDPIKDIIRSDYVEPLKKPKVTEIDTTKVNLLDLMTELDCYIGYADGYSYASYERLIRMRKKGILKRVGPSEMYRYKGTTSMNIGWWQKDPCLEKTDHWYKLRKPDFGRLPIKLGYV